jgi:hypothetical protein
MTVAPIPVARTRRPFPSRMGAVRGYAPASVALVALGVASVVAACSTGNPASPGAVSVLDGGASTVSALGRGLRRLSRREYNNVVRDLLGDTTQPANQFGIEVYVNGYDNGSAGLIVGSTDVDAFQAAAEGLAARAVQGNLAALIGTCDPTTNAAACVDAFLATFPKKAYRRPPTDTEIQRLRTVNAAGAASGGGFAGGLQLMVEAVLQSPAFLYREELGAPDPSLPRNVVRLTDYEVASELSFLVTGTMPDAELVADVDAGRLKTTDDLLRETARLLTSSAAKPSIRSFVHQWMATDQVATLNKDATIYPTFNPAVASSMAGELDRYFDEVLWNGEGSLRDLFTSPQSFVDTNLAAIYGIGAPGSGFAPVTLDSQLRRGVFTRAGFLAAHADVDSSGPIPRGVFVLDAILCNPPPPPPANVPAAPPVAIAVQAHQTTRQRFDAHLTQTFCKGCHTQIDGVGFGFEQFDGIGAARTTENGSPVDTNGVLQNTDVDGPFHGASELEAKLMTSQEVLACFIRQMYRFAMGREESIAQAATMKSLGHGFTADSRVTDVIASLVSDPSFVLRTTIETSP